MGRVFNLSDYPIWFKLLLVLGFGMLLLLIPGTLLLSSAAQELAARNGAAYLARVGAEQSTVLSNALTQASENLATFVADPDNNAAMTALLIGDVRTNTDLNLPPADADAMEQRFRSTIMNPAATLFELVRLVDTDGRVLARADVATTAGVGTRDASESVAFQAAQQAAQAGQYNTQSVSEVLGIGVVEYTRALRWRDGRVLGYLIGRVSNTRVIYPNLRFPNTGYNGFSYLATASGVALSPSERRGAVQPGSTAALTAAALSGASGTQTFRTEQGEQIGFYTGVRGSPLSLIAQISALEPLAEANQLFNTRNFIVVLGGALIVLTVTLMGHVLLASPIGRLRRAADAISAGRLDVSFPETGRADEIGRLAGSLEALRGTMNQSISALEQRIAARTRDIEATQEITRYATTERDVTRLMNRVVDLVCERFPIIYHAQIFLLDSAREYAIVRASTGEAGQKLLARGHRLAVGSISVIGQVTEQGRSILARDTSTSQVHRRNEFLPDTRAELAIPLMVGEQVIGAFDVQSTFPDAFDEQLVALLSTMAEQIAIAIYNARLYDENQRRAVEIERINREATRRSWTEYLLDGRQPMLEKVSGMASSSAVPVRDEALQAGRVVAGAVTERSTIPLAVPIMLRGQTLGVVEWEIPAAGFSQEKLELAQELAGRLAISLENARLFEESRRAAERERQVNQIASRLSAQSNLDDILRTAVREVGRALGAPQVSIRLNASASPGLSRFGPGLNEPPRQSGDTPALPVPALGQDAFSQEDQE